MYYFKLPVFTKLSRIQNIIILSFQLIILIISISISLYRGCSYESNKFVDGCNVFNILSGNQMVTNRSYSSWQFLNPIKYSSKTLSELYNIKYINIINTTLDEYLLFKGTIVLFDENKNNYDAIFKDSLAQLAYDDDFSYYFNKSVNMNNEIYRIVIDNGFFEIKFLNNCSTNSVLFEKNGKCFFQNNTYEDINKFLNNYFNEEFLVPYSCHNCYMNGINTLDEVLTVLSKCLSIFFMLNSLLILIYIFVMSKLEHSEIGYIKDIIYKNNVVDYNLSTNDINEIIKN